MDFCARDTASALLRRRKCISRAFGDSDGHLARYGRLIMRYFGARSFYRCCTGLVLVSRSADGSGVNAPRLIDRPRVRFPRYNYVPL